MPTELIRLLAQIESEPAVWRHIAGRQRAQGGVFWRRDHTVRTSHRCRGEARTGERRKRAQGCGRKKFAARLGDHSTLPDDIHAGQVGYQARQQSDMSD
jgi:hypothetical protein